MATPHHLTPAILGWPQWVVLLVALLLVMIAMMFVTG